MEILLDISFARVGYSDRSREVKPGILSSTFHFPEIMLNIITRSVALLRSCDMHDTEALCPEYKVVSCRIGKLEMI
ncbi:MAG: hypothetical protein H6595_05085 [Flavobacteriales bacterium]|nr:hypothetical protein [Flavobacteriales bacterium]MCB9166837.1 hypothetical protein [Flavobacteriales bacterium]